MKEQFNAMQSQLQALISAIGDVNQTAKNEMAKQLIEKGVYKCQN
jgi:hypothetical protein